jgi:hypothetical protein
MNKTPLANNHPTIRSSSHPKIMTFNKLNCSFLIVSLRVNPFDQRSPALVGVNPRSIQIRKKAELPPGSILYS